MSNISQPEEREVAAWEQLPEWQRETDADIFEAIEGTVLQETSPVEEVIRDEEG